MSDALAPTPSVFVSHRRSGSPCGYSLQLARDLRQSLEVESVFHGASSAGIGSLDLQTRRAAESCSVMLVVIDQQWLDSTTVPSSRDDRACMEIEIGLKRGIPVVPILVGGVTRREFEQSRDSLHAGVRALPDHQAFVFRDVDWGRCLERLVNQLSPYVPTCSRLETIRRAVQRGSRLRKRLLRLTAALAAVGGAIGQGLREDSFLSEGLVGTVFLVLATTLVGWAGVSRADRVSAKALEHRFQLAPSFEGGVYGGLVGGVVGGLGVGAAYFLDLASDPDLTGTRSLRVGQVLACLIVPYGGLSGALTGALVQLGGSGGDWLAQCRGRIAPFLGMLLGGGGGGVLCGLAAWVFFSPRSAPALQPRYVVGATPLCALAIVLGVLLYSYEGHVRFVLRAVLVSSASALPVVALAIAGLDLAPYQWHFDDPFEGLAVGATAGMAIGMTVGLSVTLYRVWRCAERQSEQSAHSATVVH